MGWCLFVPFLIHQVMVGIRMGFFAYGFASFLDPSGRDSCPYARLKALICRYYGSCGDDRSVRHDRVVHDDRSHADNYIIAYYASMHNRTVAYRNIISDDAFRLLVCSVEDRIVLDVHAVADPYRSHIPAQHRTVPYAAVVSHCHCSYYRRRLRQKRPFSYNGHVALEFFDYCHKS